MNRFINKILDYLLNQVRAIKQKIKTYNQNKNADYIFCNKCNRHYNHKDRIYISAMEENGKTEKGTYSDCPFCKKINYKEN